MRKPIKILAYLTIFTLIILQSCVNDDDYVLPDISIPDPNISANTTFAAVISRYEQAIEEGIQIAIFNEIQDVYIEGYVISSDQAGNFFEELIIQNHPDDSNPNADPRRGLRIEINVRSLSDTYEFGRKVYVKLNGLAVGESNGVITLGKPAGNNIGQIQEFEYLDFIIRDPEVIEVVPKIVTIDNLTEDDENTLIQLQNVQINRSQLGLTFAGEPSDDFDGFRTLESCTNSSSIILQTSTFADFKSLQLPQKSGNITGILSRDFFDAINVLVINSIADVEMNNERCDPDELDCGLASSVGTTNLFYDDFETQITNQPISGNGWTNYIETGTAAWEAYMSGGSNSSQGISARIDSYQSGDASTIGWLITPAIDLTAHTEIVLHFETSNSFSDNSNLEVLYSSDWNGSEEDITNSTWGVISAAYIVQDDDYFGSWFESGLVDLSCGSGVLYKAFRYVGSGQDNFDGTYELDNVSINVN